MAARNLGMSDGEREVFIGVCPDGALSALQVGMLVLAGLSLLWGVFWLGFKFGSRHTLQVTKRRAELLAWVNNLTLQVLMGRVRTLEAAARKDQAVDS